MRIKFSYLLLLAVAAILAISACKAKRGAGSANVRTLSLKYPKSFYLSFAGRSPEDTVISSKELASVNNIKIMSDGKEAKDIKLKFTCTIIKTSGESAQFENDGTAFSSEIKGKLKELQAGDKFSLEKIRIISAQGQETSYPSMEFRVK
jgi:hypothetical protein